MKIRIGIIFGGQSKEREISFAGGRTVYDNLDKSLFEPIPLFVDSFGNLILLDWKYVYKGSIRDFYPPIEFIPSKGPDFQIYAESLGSLSREEQLNMASKIGERIYLEDLPERIDCAFLCLHGPFGEDGKIQGALDYLGIPYTGSGILPSAIGINKIVQKELMRGGGFEVPNYYTLSREEWKSTDIKEVLFNRLSEKVGFPMVIKAGSQGSSIGVSILDKADLNLFERFVNKSFFIQEISSKDWMCLNDDSKTEFIRVLADIREGIGMPINIFSNKEQKGKLIHHPSDLLSYLNQELERENFCILESIDGEHEIVIEQFIEGKEFSCIVVKNERTENSDLNFRPIVALPPTEIIKGKELFDYRSKYLPGLSRKITPIHISDEKINRIRQECERLFELLKFNVYARIDGFITDNGKVFLNDPNTTSGMMPSSFFFHQAAEIGLDPSQFLTYIIRASLVERSLSGIHSLKTKELLVVLDSKIAVKNLSIATKEKIAVLLGGYSSERHISVESGRNIYEKLASSTKYQAIPIFLTGNPDQHLLYKIPVNVLLKDNADDIKEKIDNYKVHSLVNQTIEECKGLTLKYSNSASLEKPLRVDYSYLKENFDGVFIALHGRPGEDGAVQAELEKVGLPYNGSDQESSEITINKFETNEILRKNGLLIAEHLVLNKERWIEGEAVAIEAILTKINYPFIAKPLDDGCSSAVRKIKSETELKAFAKLIFREDENLDADSARILNIKQNEEFPRKDRFLVEELISKKDATHFLEITGGMLTSYDKTGNINYEVFEASEALAGGEVLSLEEKFLAGQGQNITPARYSIHPEEQQLISNTVKIELGKAAALLNVQGYCRIDAFVRIYDARKVEVIFIEVNSLPGMTPATCIFHQSAINGYKPFEFIDKILEFGVAKKNRILKV